MKMRLELGCHPTSALSTLNESESYQKDHGHNRTTILGEELKTKMISVVKNLKQEIIPMVKELNTAQYSRCRDDTELYTW